jgi:hypothetical protein
MFDVRRERGRIARAGSQGVAAGAAICGFLRDAGADENRGKPFYFRELRIGVFAAEANGAESRPARVQAEETLSSAPFLLRKRAPFY